MLCAPGSPSHRRWAPRSGGGKRRSPCPGMVQRLVQPLHDALICGPSRSWRTLFRLTHARRSEEIRILGPSLHSPSQPLSLRGGRKAASGGRKPIARLRIGRTGPQPVGALEKPPALRLRASGGCVATSAASGTYIRQVVAPQDRQVPPIGGAGCGSQFLRGRRTGNADDVVIDT